MVRVGVISDTHGLLRREAVAILDGCDHIVHCGDIGAEQIIGDLARLAPLTLVRGNNDKGPWAGSLPLTKILRLEDACIYVLHDIAQLDLEPGGAGIQAVLFGHSHRPSVTTKDGVLFVNPGSAGPRRFKLPITVAEMIINGQSIAARILDIRLGNAA